MKFNALLTVEGDAEKLMEALKNESSSADRSSLDIKQKNNNIEIRITAKDAVAFRATLNSITQLLTIYQKIKEAK